MLRGYRAKCCILNLEYKMHRMLDHLDDAILVQISAQLQSAHWQW